MASDALLAGSRPMFLRVGLLILIGIAAVVALVLFLSNVTFSKGVQLETYFAESVQGLDVGAPVKYLGVTLGRVTDIGLVSAEYGQHQPIDVRRATYRLVYVRFVIDPRKIGRTVTSEGIADAAKAGLRARVAAEGITGISYLALDFVNPKLYPPATIAWVPQNPVVPSTPSTISQVQTAAEKVATELQQIDFKDLAQGLIGVTQDLHQQLQGGQLDQTLITATEVLKSLQTTVDQADLPALTTSLKKSGDAVGALAQSRALNETLTNANRATAELAEVARMLPPLVSSLSRTIERTDATTAEIERGLVPMLRDLGAASENLRETTEQLRSYPAGTLFGGPPPRSGGR